MKWLILVLIILALPAVSATKVFDQLIYPGDAFTFDGRGASLTMSSSHSIMVIMDDGKSVILAPGQTRHLDEYEFYYAELHLEICTTSDCSPKQYAKIDPNNNFQIIPGVKLIIHEQVPEMKVSRITSESEVLLNTPVDIQVTVENIGSNMATNVEFTDTFPEGITLLSADRGFIQGNRLRVQLGSISGGDKEVINYRVMLTENIEAKLLGDLNFKYAGIDQQTVSNFIILKVRNVFKVTSAFTPTQTELGQEKKWSLTIENTNKEGVESAKVNKLILDMPPEMTIKSSPQGFMKTGLTYTLENVNIESQEKKVYNFTISSLQTGQQRIQGTLDGYFRQPLATQTFMGQTSWGQPANHKYKVELTPTSRDYLEGTTSYSWLFIKNDDNFPLHDIEAVVDINGTIFTHSLPVLQPQQGHSFDTHAFALPKTNDSFTITISANVTMRSGLDQQIIHSNPAAKINVKTIKDAFDVQMTGSKGTKFPQNDTQLITVKLKNKLDHNTISDIKVTPIIPQQFAPSAPAPRTLSLGPGQEQTLYTYSIRAPFFFNTSQKDLIKNIVVAGLEMNKTLTLDVELQKPSLTLTRNVPSPAIEGHVIEDRFVVTNTGNHRVTNIRFSQDGVPGYDIHRQRHMNINELSNQESVTRTVLARVVKNGTLVLPPTSLLVIDRYGNEQTMEFPGRTITVTSAGIFDAAVVVDTTVVKIEDRQITLEATLHNRGERATVGTFTHADYAYEIDLNPKETKTLLYTVPVPRLENVTLPAATFSYTAEQQQWMALGLQHEFERELTEIITEEELAQSNTSTQDEQEGWVRQMQNAPSWFRPDQAFTFVMVLGVGLVMALFAFGLVRKKLLKRRENIRGEFDDYFK